LLFDAPLLISFADAPRRRHSNMRRRAMPRRAAGEFGAQMAAFYARPRGESRHDA